MVSLNDGSAVAAENCWTMSIVFSERHAMKLMREYIAYQNTDYCHYGLAKDALISRLVMHRPGTKATSIALPRVGGIHHRYEWRDAA